MKRVFLWGLVIVFASTGIMWLWLKYGTYGFSALQEPSSLEAVLAASARRLAMPAGTKSLQNPVAFTPQVLAEGRAHWADHCAMCHANDGGGDTEMGRHMYPRAPDMRSGESQQKTDGELFYLIENGIRLSGMPGWHVEGHEVDSWKLVHFVRHLPQVTPEELLEMEKLNPKGPEDRNEEREEEEFLNQGTAPRPHAHHH
jgi:mono/diheme cytochrome c family protein